MHPPCPTCQTDLTPSIVGYLCHNCGETHSFEKLGSSQTHTQTKHNDLAQSQQKSTKSKNSTHSNQSNPPNTNVMPPVSRQRKSIKHHVQGFVVPTIASLPKPIDESHLLESHYADVDEELSQAPLGKPTEAVISTAPAKSVIKKHGATQAVAHDISTDREMQKPMPEVPSSSGDKTLFPALIIASLIIIISLIVLFVF